ncbi:testis-expressed protein 13A-like [Eubalaena glacialis]|uniref:testis-expressed protein 13A-like n=1 Tax=Eubalaena glacialis TaxID=27606 RepID=UPI002A59B114|nr:testis-expressed protein 13A-like [Eubalaena glacialis]
MAVNFNDPACGFYQREVVDFLNEQILQNEVSSYFYSLRKSKSWGDMEKKLRDIVTNSAISGRLKEACAWSSLALAVRFAKRQKSEDAEKVKKLQDQLEEQKLLTNALRGMVSRLRGMQEREKEKAQSQLQQSLTILHEIEEERNLLRSELIRVLSTRSRQQVGTRGEGKEKEKEAQTSGVQTYSHGTANCWLRGEAGKGSDQETAALPEMAAVGGEAKKDKMISQWGNDEGVANFSCPPFLGARVQARQLLPLNVSQFSNSSPPTVPLAGARADAAAAPPVRNSRTRWNRRRSHTRKFSPGFSHSARRTVRRRMGDWDCAWCHSMNFLWRKMCFKCKKSCHTRESRGSAPNQGPR